MLLQAASCGLHQVGDNRRRAADRDQVKALRGVARGMHLQATSTLKGKGAGQALTAGVIPGRGRGPPAPGGWRAAL